MKFKTDYPPQKQNHSKTEAIKGKEGFEKIKNDFSLWVDGYLKDLYENGNSGKSDSWWQDPVQAEICNLTGEEERITTESKDLTLIFGEKLKSFCENIILGDYYDEQKIKTFYSNLHNTFFNRSPNIFENLNVDFLQKVIMSSKINETYGLREVVDISGEMAYDLSFCSVDKAKEISEDIKKLSGSEKISAIKQLANTAMMAYSNGSWAYPAFRGVIQLISDVKNSENSPIVSFVLDFELKKIKNFSHNLDRFEEVDFLEDYEEENLHEKEKRIRDDVQRESTEFFLSNDIALGQKNVYYTRVSKDYGTIVSSSTLIPFALVKKVESTSKNESIFSADVMKKLENFLKYFEKIENPKTQDYMDMIDILTYLNNKDEKLLSDLELKNPSSIFENQKKLVEIYQEIKNVENNVYSQIEKENYNKTKEVFDYIDKNFDSIFVGKLKKLGEEWLRYKQEKYDDGMFEVMSEINSTTNLLSLSSKTLEELSNKNRELRDFHIKNFDSVNQRVQAETKELEVSYSEKIEEIESMAKEIPLDKFKHLIKDLIEKDKLSRSIVPLESYTGLTKNKILNPLGSDDFSHLIKILHTPEIKDYINKRLKINIEDLYLREQIQFLKFLSTSNEGLFQKLEVILENKDKEHNNNFLRSFLSMSGDERMGDKILALGEKLPEDVARKVFSKYGEIIDNVSKITEFTKTNFTKEIETSPDLILKIEETLYLKGKQLLSQTYDDINNKKEINYEDISKQLDRINADTITTFAIFKQAVKNGEKLPIESIEGSVFSKEEATNISDDQKQEMSDLYDRNYRNNPDREFIAKVKEYFDTAFVPSENKQKNYFYTFKKDNKIRAFVRFEKKKDEGLYASALNVDEASKNFGLGEAMMDEALSREAQNYILHASCLKNNPSNMRYFEKGFISRGFKKTNETEEFDLVWDENKNKDILAKQKTQEELINMQNTDDIEVRKSEDLESLHRNIPEGKSLVRCFQNGGGWYAVYEAVSPLYGENFSEVK